MKVDTKEIDLSSLHRLHGKDRPACDYPVAHFRKPTKDSEYKSADCSSILVRNIEAEAFIELADVRAPRDHRLARACQDGFCHILGCVVLVENLSDDFLEKIFHRDNARSSTVLVEHDCH